MKKTRKKPGRSCMDGASRGLAFGVGHLHKTRLRLIGPFSVSYKQEKASVFFLSRAPYPAYRCRSQVRGDEKQSEDKEDAAQPN